MIRIDIPGRGQIQLQHAVFDIDGTIAEAGVPYPGVTDRLHTLSSQLSIHALTAETPGNLEDLERTLGIPVKLISTGQDKVDYVRQLGPQGVIAFGNGANDAGMLRLAAIGVAVLTAEGIAVSALQAADILIYDPVNALELLLLPERLVATLRE